MNPVIVYGPQGCGKSRHAEAIRRMFGRLRVVDEWVPGDPLDLDAVHLTHADLATIGEHATEPVFVVPFAYLGLDRI